MPSADSSDEELIKCCNKVEAMTKDKKNKTIVDIIIEDFSTTPFNSPTSSPERNVDKSPSFILRQKPKRFYSRKKKGNYNDIEKKDIHNIVIESVVVETGPETGINEKYDWDDNDLFVSINTQEIPVNKQITQGNQKASGERPELGEGKNVVGVNEIFTDNEWEEMKNEMHQDEVGKVNNPVSAGFETANGKKISISEEGQKSVQYILREFQGNLQETDYETEMKEIKGRISNKSMESKCETIAKSSSKDGASGSSNRAVSLLSLNRKHYLKNLKDRMESKCETIAKSSSKDGAMIEDEQQNNKNPIHETYF
uniref:Uncharacterized protein n=1 Tax=Glossina morsitans morsitans TaxID=37546 RepID=A0A1B0GDA1_GLOMM